MSKLEELIKFKQEYLKKTNKKELIHKSMDYALNQGIITKEQLKQAILNGRMKQEDLIAKTVTAFLLSEYNRMNPQQQKESGEPKS
jgi:hypothetical protein